MKTLTMHFIPLPLPHSSALNQQMFVVYLFAFFLRGILVSSSGAALPLDQPPSSAYKRRAVCPFHANRPGVIGLGVNYTFVQHKLIRFGCRRKAPHRIASEEETLTLMLWPVGVPCAPIRMTDVSCLCSNLTVV